MDNCVFCQQQLGESGTTTLGQKGCDGIKQASEERGEDILVTVGQRVHTECRRKYCNPHEVAQFNRQKRSFEAMEAESVGCRRRSADPAFSYRDMCLFCGMPDKYDGKKNNFKLIPVRTFDFQKRLLELCRVRSDDWSKEVQGRIEFVNDLHAADAVYHKVCNGNFRSGKSIPKYFIKEMGTDDSSKHKKVRAGRPKELSRVEALEKVIDDLRRNDDEQTTIGDLVNNMKQYLDEEEPYSFRHMKEQLLQRFGDEIFISEVSGRQNVVTFRANANKILHDFFQQERSDEMDKGRVISAAAELIKADIKRIEQSKTTYPSSLEMSTLEQVMSFIPASLQLFLRTLFVGAEKETKIGSIGQAIMQATRPRALLCPVQIGLGVQMHRHFASRFLIDSLHTHGFCSSYSEVHMFEKCSAATRGTDIPGLTEGHFVQYVADNVDHNLCTIDGKGTFHGMGIIACITPSVTSATKVPRINVTMKDLEEVGQINIRHYVQKSNHVKDLTFVEIEESDEARVSASDTLWKISLSLGKNPRPSWSGMMRMVHDEADFPGQSSVMFMPMIDMDPSDLTCLNSTLLFVTEHAVRYGYTPVLTFDQPLYWKAMTIIENEPEGSQLKSVVLRLGSFHILMSFLGCIGHLMSGSGLEELLELVYAENAVPKMLNGKAVARAVRGHFIVDGALNKLLTSKTFDIKLPSKDTEPDGIDSEHADSCSSTSSEMPDVLMEAAELYDSVVSGAAVELEESECLKLIAECIEKEILQLKGDRTAQLWLQYMEMVDLVRNLLRSERTGNWLLHLDTLRKMMPFLASAGHNLYVKSLNVYLQKMDRLMKNHPGIHKCFIEDGLQVVRRSDDFWAGLPPDLVIEQTLMRSIKTTGGLTRGRGMSEAQRLVWVMSNHVTSEVNLAMQQLTKVNYATSEQHKDLQPARLKRDVSDTLEILSLLELRSPFSGSEGLVNIVNGVTANASANVDNAKEVGRSILKKMEGEKVIGFSFKKKSQAVLMDSKSTLKLNDEETVKIDPQLLFQRLVIAGTQAEQLPEALEYELCGYPPALFETRNVLLPANKPQLAKPIWDVATAVDGPKDCVFVLDGGALLQRIPWDTGKTYNAIAQSYSDYIRDKYSPFAIVVFDGYSNTPSTKDSTHTRRNGRPGRKVTFTGGMVLKLKKHEFLSNSENKQRFINLLTEKLQADGVEVHNAQGDADLLIVQTAVATSQKVPTVVVGDDTDLIVLLCYHAKDADLYFMPEPKGASSSCRKYLDVRKARQVLGDSVTCNILFLHAILGCDTTSRIFGIGKAVALTLMKEDSNFREQAEVFYNSNSTKDAVVQAGEKALVCIFNGSGDDTLNAVRLRKFQILVARSKTSVHPQKLPPTSAAAKFHSLRVYHQVQEWKGNSLNPEEWGWKVCDGRLVPIQTEKDTAPKSLLEVIRCQCKTDCSTLRCKCRRQGLDCSMACSECRENCSNTLRDEEDEESDTE